MTVSIRDCYNKEQAAHDHVIVSAPAHDEQNDLPTYFARATLSLIIIDVEVPNVMISGMFS